MNLKSLIAVFVIIGIGAMLLRTESGMSYTTQALEFLKVRVGNFVAGLTGKDIWSKESGHFRIVLTADKSSFAEQSFQLTNSSLTVSGVVESLLNIGSVELHKRDMSINVEIKGAKGTFEYTSVGTVKFDGTVSSIDVDDNSYTSSKGDLKVSFEIVPVSFALDPLSQKKLVLSSATGSLVRLNEDGSIKSSEELAGEELEINKFYGVLKLEGTNTILDGTAESVKGTGTQSSFSW